MFRILAKPYPYICDWKLHVRTAFYISVFVTFFLLLFKPFGLGNFQGAGLSFRIAGYGFVTWVTLLLVFFMSRMLNPHPDEERWTTGKEILRQLMYIFVLGIANVCYTHFVFGLHFSVSTFIDFQVYTLLIGVFPVSFFVLVNHLKLLHRHQETAAQLTEEISKYHCAGDENRPGSRHEREGLIRLTSENGKDRLDLPVDDLVLIESADNYSTVYFFQHGKMQSKLLRSSLKRMETEAPHENLLRCHRTYIVNLQKVVAVNGNAQGYRLRFDGFDQTFPVSRSLNETIKERLHHLTQR